jgi:hypothetical protein
MAAATRTGKALMFDAVSDTYAAQIVDIAGISFQGSGLTAAQNLILTDDAGQPIVDYLIEGATDNADLWAGRDPQFYTGLKMSGTVDGTWKLTVFLN